MEPWPITSARSEIFMAMVRPIDKLNGTVEHLLLYARPTAPRLQTVAVGALVLDVESDAAGERVVKVRGDEQHPVSKGYACTKGRALGRMHHHPDALEPLAVTHARSLGNRQMRTEPSTQVTTLPPTQMSPPGSGWSIVAP